MFTASFAVTLLFTLMFNSRYGALVPAVGVSTIIAAAATVVELFTPFGIDNITVPLAVAALYAGVVHLTLPLLAATGLLLNAAAALRCPVARVA